MTENLIIGGSSQLGNALYSHLTAQSKKVSLTYNSFKIKGGTHLDFTKKNEVEYLINFENPKYIFLTAAFTNVEYCEKRPEIGFSINVSAVQDLVNVIKYKNIKLIYFSSDYIFDGKNGPYFESDTPNPINQYGKQKLQAERIITESLNNFLIIRTTGIYGWEYQQKNFVSTLKKSLEQQKITKVPIDQISSPTYSSFLATATLDIAFSEEVGIFNIAGKNIISRFDFSNEVANVFKLNPNLIYPVLTSQLNQTAKRPLHGGLLIDKIKNIIINSPMDTIEYLQHMSNNKGNFDGN